MIERPFRVLGIQQIAIGGRSKADLSTLWTDLLGVQKVGDFVSESENVDEFVLRLPTQGAEKRYNDTVLRVFQGNALPSDLQRVDDTAAPAADQTAAPATAAPTTAGTASSAVDIPTVDPYGFVPPDDPTCH